jgi:hypothetical protein
MHMNTPAIVSSHESEAANADAMAEQIVRYHSRSSGS